MNSRVTQLYSTIVKFYHTKTFWVSRDIFEAYEEHLHACERFVPEEQAKIGIITALYCGMKNYTDVVIIMDPDLSDRWIKFFCPICREDKGGVVTDN